MTDTTSPIALELHLPRMVPDVIALGAFLKNTVTVIHRDTAFVSRSVGDLSSPEAIRAFETMVARMLEVTGANPVLVAHDLHPDFPSTRFAESMGLPTLAVQHHHAHMAAVSMEHWLNGGFIGLAMDGFGLGPENESWGGEMLSVNAHTYTRIGRLGHLRQPGGDIAAREPWRMGAAALHALGRGEEIHVRYKDQPQAPLLCGVLDKGISAPLTSSCGRLFDAACGLLGVKLVTQTEGEAPMELERMVGRTRMLEHGYDIKDGVLDFKPLLAWLADCTDPKAGAEVFHGVLAAAMAEWTFDMARKVGIQAVTLGGGCFYNRVLRADIVGRLEAYGLHPLMPRELPPGDLAISAGQAWVAGQYAAST